MKRLVPATFMIVVRCGESIGPNTKRVLLITLLQDSFVSQYAREPDRPHPSQL